MRILVSNDDGIRADGLKVLEEAAREIAEDVWIVAPESEQSGAGHSLSLHDPLRVRQIEPQRFAVDGTPTDCVLLALKELIAEPVDLVISGVNRGCNVAEDVTYSGTIAAAMEGTLLGVPAIAFSQLLDDGGEPLWETASHYAADIIRKLYKIGWPKHNMINVNFPAVPPTEVKGTKLCPMGERKIGEKLIKRQDPKGRDYYWIGGPGTVPSEQPGADDVLLSKGYITITPIDMDMTNYKVLEDIREHFEV